MSLCFHSRSADSRDWPEGTDIKYHTHFQGIMMIRQNQRSFTAGQIMATSDVLQQIPEYEVQRALARHLSGDWGDCCLEDSGANEEALQSGGRLFSVYHTADGIKFWIITEADRSATTVLLPENY
ncbi:hypothetical protein V6x_16310 [Gimesia chilikensis]|uniref:Type I restriction endonuclease subunit M n=2 Tax=Gimesia chilikensis TaxID=2605989 RepID=A0A517W9M9_9PLAN|nr:hypothetical protein V6x_16310 [Gimesia chilikensis]